MLPCTWPLSQALWQCVIRSVAAYRLFNRAGSRDTPGKPFHVAMSSANDEATSLWLRRNDKQLVRDYRDEVFGDSDVALRHAIRHAIQQAQGDSDE